MILLATLLTVGCGDDDSWTHDVRRGDFLAATYNVSGLPEGISNSSPSIAMPQIGPLLNDYDLVLLQESWKTPDPNPLAPMSVYHEILEETSEHPFKSVSMPLPLWADPDRPEAMVSDGLNRFSVFSFEPVMRQRWAECAGDDCLSLKGFSFARTRFADNVEIDVYNLHMQAGGVRGYEIRAQGARDMIA